MHAKYTHIEHAYAVTSTSKLLGIKFRLPYWLSCTLWFSLKTSAFRPL